ncbi:hypothetical protein [Nocardia brasiliensis]|nr:hypothetical protein [Nocardia brasiliensis]
MEQVTQLVTVRSRDIAKRGGDFIMQPTAEAAPAHPEFATADN